MIVPLMLGVGVHAVVTQPHAQRHELRAGTTGSSTEPCSETTLSAEEIHDRLRAGAQHAALHDPRAEIQQLAGKYAIRLATIKLLTAQMEESWHGDAAEGAARYSRPATDVVESSGTRLDESARDHGPLHRQDDAYTEVLRTVVKLPPKPESDLLNTINPFETDTDRAIKKYNDDAARNIAAYADYYAASGENGRAMPHRFPVPPSGSAPTVVVVPGRGDAGAGPRSTYAPVPAVAADSGSSPTVSANAGAGAPVAGGPAWTPPAYDPVSDTAAQTRPAETGRPVPAGPAPAAAAAPPVPGGAGAPGGALGGLFARQGGGGARGPGGLGGLGGSGGSGGGSGGAGESGQRAQGGADSRGRGGVVGAGGVERGGAPGGGAPVARRGKDSDEDSEHRTKYLKSEDLGKQWGATDPVAPPVIGDRR